MNIKNSIRNNIVFPAIESGGNSLYEIGQVIATNEETNTCTVKYKDSKGKTKTEKNILVRNTSSSVIDWFPEKNDLVLLEVIANKAVIIGEPEIFTGLSSKSNNTIESDIYSDNVSGSTIGGNIY